MLLPVLLGLGSGLVVALAVRGCCRLYVVQGDSMLPTLRRGDWVLVRRLFGRERLVPGGIAVFARAGAPPTLIKRVLAGPGGAWPGQLEAPAEGGELPSDSYLFQSENLPPAERRRRVIGPIPRGQVCGKALLVVWPGPRVRWLGRNRLDLLAEATGAQLAGAGPRS